MFSLDLSTQDTPSTSFAQLNTAESLSYPQSPCILSSCIFFTIFTLPLSNPSIQLPHYPSYFTCSRPMTRQSNTIILVQYGLAISGGLQSNTSRFYVVPSTFKDRPPIVLSLDEIPHRIKQVSLGRSLPRSQCLLFPLELEVHPSQPPRTQQAQLKDNNHAATTDRNDTMI